MSAAKKAVPEDMVDITDQDPNDIVVEDTKKDKTKAPGGKTGGKASGAGF